VAAAPAAHHSYAMFDMVRQVEVKGKVKEYQWTNPHLWIEVLVPNASGGEDQYSVEGLNLRSMRSLGWTRTTLVAGDAITVAMHPFRNGDKGGSLMWVVLANGTTLGGGVPANVTTD
jgi:hypothetical protein